MIENKRKIFIHATLSILLCLIHFVILAVYFFRGYYIPELIVSFWPYLALFQIALSIILLWIWKRNSHIIFFKVAIIVSFVFSLVGIYITMKPYVFASVKPLDIHFSSESTLDVFVLNIHRHNEQVDLVGDFVMSHSPDIVALIEITAEQYVILEPRIKEVYPYSNAEPSLFNSQLAGNLILSKYPISDTSMKVIDGKYKGYAYADIDIDGEIYKFFVVHTTSPVSKEDWQNRHDQMQVLMDDIGNNLTKPVFVIGDFNMTPWSADYQEFLGRFKGYLRPIGFGSMPIFTWSPFKKYFLDAHIDHAFIPRGYDLSDSDLSTFAGTDHKGLVFQVVDVRSYIK